MRRAPLRSLLISIAFACACSAAVSAADGERHGLYEGLYLELGSFLPLEAGTEIDVSGLGPAPIEGIDLDRELRNENRADRFRLRGGYRFNRRHEIEFSYHSMRRVLENSFEGSFQLDGDEFLYTLDYTSTFRTQDVELGYKYFILARPRAELGFSVGIHGILTDLTLDAEVSITPGFEDLRDLTFSDKDSLDVPLPYLGLHFDLQLTRKLYFGALGKILDVEIDDYDGSWWTFELTLEHWTFKQVGFGVGYFFTNLEVTKTGDQSIAGVDLEQSGVQAFVRFNI